MCFHGADYIDIRVNGDRAVAKGGHLQSPVVLNDVLLAKGGAEFVVQGRAADLVKIGGKRSSLEALTAELNRMPGVVDGVFWLPDPVPGTPQICLRSDIIAIVRGHEIA